MLIPDRKDAFFGKLEFLKLPPELRLCVYEQLFGLQVGKTVRQLDAYHSAEQGRVPKVYKVWDRGDGPARGESEVKVLRTCRQVYQEGTDVLYNRNYFRLTVSENFRSTYETWFDAPRVNLRTTLLGRIQNLTLEIVIWSHEQVYDWLKMRLASTQHCHFFDEMPALKTLRLSIMRQDSGNSLARSGRARSTPDIDGSASLLFWLLQAIPRDVNIVWEAHKRKVYGPGVYLSVHTLKRLAKQYTKIRGTALTIDEARREPRPDRLEEPELLKQVRSEVVKDAKKEVRREGDRRRREIARVRAGLKTFTTSTHGEYETFL